jgi:hypothetical protein
LCENLLDPEISQPSILKPQENRGERLSSLREQVKNDKKGLSLITGKDDKEKKQNISYRKGAEEIRLKTNLTNSSNRT